MNRLEAMNAVIKHIEKNLTQIITLEALAKIAGCSVYEFSRVFSFVANMAVSEYIRRRRLSAAVYDLQKGDSSILDISLKYCYESPTAFTRAFKEMHGATPSAVRKTGVTLKTYSPITFELTIRGMEALNFRIEKSEALYISGIQGYLSPESQNEGPASLWNAPLKADGVPTGKKSSQEKIDEFLKKYELTESYIATPENKILCTSLNGDKTWFTVAIDYRTEDGKVRVSAGFVRDNPNEESTKTAETDADAAKFADFLEDPEQLGTHIYTEPIHIPHREWAVFTFENTHSATDTNHAYARIFDWFENSGYTRVVDMHHLEKFRMGSSAADSLQVWEVWMPIK